MAQALSEVWAILKRKPWLALWPVMVVALWMLHSDQEAPWWLRYDLSEPEES